jgi:tetratricopeptide (TPR) repeat protein
MRCTKHAQAIMVFALIILCLGCSGSRKKDEEVDAFLQNSAGYYIKKGSDAINAGQYQDALLNFRKAIALTPYDPVAHNDIGVAFYHLGQLDSALAYYQAAIRLRPDYIRAISNLSKTYLDMGDINYALAASERITELAPAAAAGYLLRADIYDKNNQPEEAIRATLEALAADSTQNDVRNNLGVLYFRSGRLDQAIACYLQVLNQDSTYAVAYFNLGNALARRCQLEEAQVNYRKAFALKPQMTSALNNHGLIYLFLDHLHEAANDFYRALASDSASQAVHYNLSIVQSRLDSLPAALASINRAIVLQPAMASFYLQKSAILGRLGQEDVATEMAQKAVALDSTLFAGYNSLGNLMASSHPDLAKEAYEKALSNYDENILRRYGRSSQALEKGYFDLLTTCKDNWQIRTDHAMVYNNLGKAYLQLKQNEQAAKAFAKAVELQPDLWEPAENLAVVCVAQKRNQEARALFALGRLNRARAALRADSLAAAETMVQDALRLQPKLQGGHALLAQVYERKGETKLAESTLRAGVKLHPREFAIHLAYGRFLARQQRNTEAREHLLQAIALDPKQDEPRYLLAGIYRALGEPEKADQEIARVHFILGQGYEEAGLLDRAMEEYRFAAQTEPLQLDYAASQGLIYLKKRLYAEAEQTFASVLKQKENNPGALYGMGILFGERKSHEQAITWLQAAIAAAPDNGQAHQALAVNYFFLGRLDLAREQALAAQKLGVTLKDDFIQALNLSAALPR